MDGSRLVDLPCSSDHLLAGTRAEHTDCALTDRSRQIVHVDRTGPKYDRRPIGDPLLQDRAELGANALVIAPVAGQRFDLGDQIGFAKNDVGFLALVAFWQKRIDRLPTATAEHRFDELMLVDPPEVYRVHDCRVRRMGSPSRCGLGQSAMGARSP